MKPDIYEQVTDRIITQLESGVVPWKSPYFSKVGFPRNFSTGRAYQGINVFLLGSLRFTSPFFLTFIQAKELGGNVRKGEHGSLVVKYGTYTKDDEQAAAAGEDAETRRFLKAYTVFHASQIEGIEFPQPESLPELSITQKTDHAREIVAAMPNAPALHEGNAVPCYRPATDSVHMPEGRFFEGEEAYYSTLFHELAHYAAIRIMPRRWSKPLRERVRRSNCAVCSGIKKEAAAAFFTAGSWDVVGRPFNPNERSNYDIINQTRHRGGRQQHVDGAVSQSLPGTTCHPRLFGLHQTSV